MSKRIKTLLVAFVAVFCFMMCSAAPAFAYVDPEWESGKGPDETEYPTETAVVISEPTPTPTTPEQAFSTPGNGDLGDAITSGKKDFYTIHTKNNNTFYLVIDHAGNVDNVYMLSLIDANDLAQFITETEKQPEKQQQQTVVLPETTPQPTPEPVVTPEPKTESNSSLMTLITFAVIGGGAALYYFKVYKPRKESEQSISEGLETGGDGLNTVNEDKENQ